MKSFLFLALLIVVATSQNCETSDGGKGDDSVCGTNECCWYNRVGSVETWTCGLYLSPEDIEALEKAAEEACELAPDLCEAAEEVEDEYESYCDNAVLMKVSFFVVAFISFLMF